MPDQVNPLLRRTSLASSTRSMLPSSPQDTFSPLMAQLRPSDHASEPEVIAMVQSLSSDHHLADDLPETEDILMDDASNLPAAEAADVPEPVLDELGFPVGLFDGEHPYVDDQEKRKVTATNTITGMIDNVLLADLALFRTSCKQWLSKIPEKIPQPRPISRQLITANCHPEKPSAFYVVTGNSGNSLTLSPVHKELVATDRPDLNVLTLNGHSRDILNAGPICLRDYWIGDLVAVVSLTRRLNSKPSDLLRSFEGCQDPKNHRFWHVDEFYLMQRHFELNRTSAIVHGITSPTTKSITCAVSGVGALAVIPKHRITDPRLRTRGQLVTADVFVPQVQPGRFLSSLKRSSRHRITKETRIHGSTTPLPPLVVSVFPLAATLEHDLLTSEHAFVANCSWERSMASIVAAAELGLSGHLALSSKDFDPRSYATQIDVVVPSQRGDTIHFKLRNESGPPSSTLWARSTQILGDLPNLDQLIHLIVENSVLVDEWLSVSARVTPNVSSQCQRLADFAGCPVVVSQIPSDTYWQQRHMPSVNNLRSQEPSPACILLEALHGGRSIRMPEHHSEPIQIGDVRLSRQQAQYVNVFMGTSVPAVIADSPFGVGKTLMIAAAAVSASATNSPWSPKTPVHVLTGTTNTFVSALANTLQRIAPDARAVRLIHEDNRNRQESAVLSSLDYPVLWPAVFRKYLAEAERDFSNGVGMEDKALAAEAAAHLLSKDLSCPFTNPKFLSILGVKKEASHSPSSIARTFLAIYKPTIILGTVATLLDASSNGPIRSILDRVETVQIDEAGQLPKYALLMLARYMKRARIALIGDHRQLPPYADSELPPILREFGIGDLLQTAANESKIPTIFISQVRRCPPEITNLCSALFYDGNLRPARTEPINTSLGRVLGFTSSSPIHFIAHTTHSSHTVSGTSLYNLDEAKQAEKLARALRTATPTPSIGILCFYKSQAGVVGDLLEDTDGFVGTVDSSQGQEFDVTIILTTRASQMGGSPFLEDERRVNVALSRTKHLCIILASKGGISPSRIWSRVLEAIPTDARHW